MSAPSGPIAGKHPAAPDHLPHFINVSEGTDWWMVGSGIFLIAVVVGIGVFYFKFHALPEQIAHRGQKVQFEIVCVLALLAMFTHNHLFWIIGLLLALIPIPDFTTPMSSIAHSLRRVAKNSHGYAFPPTKESAPAISDQKPTPVLGLKHLKSATEE